MNIDFSKKTCFVITPIGSERTDIRDALEGLMEDVLKPTLCELGFKEDNIYVAHQIHESGSINNQIISHIVDDDINIVNLTGLNPNVMYELAVRHAVGKPVIIIAEENTKLPFDIVDQRTIFYKDSMRGAVLLRESLVPMIKSALGNNETNIDNPILKVIKEKSIIDQIKGSTIEGDINSLMFDKLLAMEHKLDRMMRSTSKNRNKEFNKMNKIELILKFAAKVKTEEEDNIINEISNYISSNSLEIIKNYENNTITLRFDIDSLTIENMNFLVMMLQRKYQNILEVEMYSKPLALTISD